jgi:dipeptidyl aminopeptidase/acylaminoacyl peptidase
MNKMRLKTAALLILSFMVLKPEDEAQAATPITIDTALTKEEIAKGILTPEIMWKFGRVGAPVVSPNGQQVAYTVSYYNLAANKGVTNVYLVSSNGGTPKQLTDEKGSESNIVWSKDGKFLYFLSTRENGQQLWKYAISDGSMQKLSNIEGGINGFQLSPDGVKIAYAADVKLQKVEGKELYPEMDKSNVMIYTDLMYRHWDSWEDGAYSHIFVADFNADRIENVVDINKDEAWDTPMATDYDMGEVQWSPDSKSIIFASKPLTSKQYATSTNSDIFIYSLTDKKTTNITSDNFGYDRYPTFSPDGKTIAWWSMKTDGYESDQKRLFLLNIATGAKTYATAGFDQNIETYTWSTDSKAIYFTSGIQGTEQVFKMDVATRTITLLTKGYHDYTACSFSNGVLVGQKMSIKMAAELFRIDPKTGKETQLTFTNANIYKHIKMAETQERWVTTTDNKKMLVWVILPVNFDTTKKYPALLYCQGGPQSTVSQFWSFRWNFQIMAANGYVVVAPNRRGVPSFGQEWNAQISGDYSGQNIKDYLSAIDDVKKESWVDADHLGCVGASYGGYSTYFLAGNHDNRFKAFIAHNGMFNLESFYAATEETFFANHDLGGAYWEKDNATAQRSFANSPHRFVQNWNTPIMVIVGGRDFRIPYTEGLQAYNAAKLRNLPAKLLVFPEETHFVTKPQNAVIWQKEFFGWLDKWLKTK